MRKVQAAVPLLKDSLRLDPSQEGLEDDIRVFDDLLHTYSARVDSISRALLHVLGNKSIATLAPVLEQTLKEMMSGNEYRARRWLMTEATQPALDEVLDGIRTLIHKENGTLFPVEVTTTKLSGELVLVRATVGPNVFEWEVDYKAKQFRARNKRTQQILDRITIRRSPD